MQPPIAKKILHVTEIHGYREIDEYAWLADRTKTNQAVLDYLISENLYTDEATRESAGLQENLYQEMRSRIQEEDKGVPYRAGDFFYYTRTETNKQYAIYCRKHRSTESTEEVVLDLNELALGHQFFDLGTYEVSDDGCWLAYTTDVLGFRQYGLHIKDLRTGETRSSVAERVTSVVWAADSETLFFTEEDELTKRSDRFFRMWRDGGSRELLFEERDDRYDIYCERTRSLSYIFLISQSSTTTETWYIEATHPEDVLHSVYVREEGRKYFCDHSGDHFLIRINDTGKNFRLISTPVCNVGLAEKEEIVAHREETMIEDVLCFERHFVVVRRQNGLTELTIFDSSRNQRTILFPESAYKVSLIDNWFFEARFVRLRYESLVTPPSIFDYDMETGERVLKKQRVVLGYDQSQYFSERIFVEASDGARVPISLVSKKGYASDIPRPMLLDGYGSYGLSNRVFFSSDRLSLLDRGVIFGIAHIRGGGEMGEAWHEQGKMMHKKNTFTDFISCALYLVQEGYTTTDQMAITGMSAGGLLMGAVANMRPDICRAIVSKVPFVDVINTMLDATLPLTTGEYLEWGNPHEREAYEYMQSYSPYDNIAAKQYPAMLILTSLHDSQVMYWEPVKYVAKLRALKTDNRPLLLRTKLEPAGHGGASGRFDQLRDTAFEYAFILTQVDQRH